MRTIKYLSIAVIALIFAGQVNLKAQPGEKNNDEHKMHSRECKMGREGKQEPFIANLTDEQKGKIKDLRLAHYKEAEPLRNQLGELRAREKTLTTAEKPDTKLINANIEEISKVQGQLMKSRTQLFLQIRALLTDEQKMEFDMHGPGEMGHKRGFFHKPMHED